MLLRGAAAGGGRPPRRVWSGGQLSRWWQESSSTSQRTVGTRSMPPARHVRRRIQNGDVGDAAVMNGGVAYRTTGCWPSGGDGVDRVQVVVMGVSGSGKTTVGERLAAQLGVPFVDGDALHPPANVAKMASGVPLTDDDRAPWLRIVGQAVAGTAPEGV